MEIFTRGPIPLQRYNRLTVQVLTYTFSAAIFTAGGAIFGSILGMGGGDGPNQRSLNSGASGGALLGAIVGAVVAHRARRTSTAKWRRRQNE